MRSSEPREGNSTKSSVGQSLLLEFGWVDNSLLEGSPQCSAENLASGLGEDIAAAERERCNSLLGLNEEYFQPRADHAVPSNWLRKVRLA